MSSSTNINPRSSSTSYPRYQTLPIIMLLVAITFFGILNFSSLFHSEREFTSGRDDVSLIYLKNPSKHFSSSEDDGSSSSTEDNANDDDDDDDDPNKCQIYLAPSSIPNSGLGIFTATSVSKGHIIKNADSPGVPIIDKFWDNLVSDMKLFSDKSWPEDRGVFDHMRYESQNVWEVSFNLGAFPNYHPYLVNIELVPHENEFDDTIFLSSKEDEGSPGIGAISEYMGKSFVAPRDIRAGEELFLNYGDADKYLSKIPNRSDYNTAATILAKLREELRILHSDDKNKGIHVDDAERLRDMLSVLHAIVPIFSEKVDALLPTTLLQLSDLVNEAEGTFSKAKLGYAAARTVNTNGRSVSWLRRNGMCLDNVLPGVSTVIHAGRGAFAARFLAGGSLVVPMPLLHVANKEVLGTYRVFRDEETGLLMRDESKYWGKQLLLNYCFGHGESSLLFCPESNGVYINHCSSTKTESDYYCGEEGPNARVRWASGWDETQKWLKASFRDVESEQSVRVVSFEVIATRDIQQGEEIFMDYGPEWEAAWDNHIANWKKNKNNNDNDDDISYYSTLSTYTSIKTLNDDSTTHPLPLSNLRTDTSPEGQIMTVCYYWDDRDDKDYDAIKLQQQRMKNAPTWQDLNDRQILRRFGKRAKYNYKGVHDWGEFWPCTIIEKEESKEEEEEEEEEYYTVRIFQLKTYEDTAWQRAGYPLFLTRMPRKNIKFFNKPYKSHLHQPYAFRHPIAIPDELFPEQWKNLRRDATTTTKQPKETEQQQTTFQTGDRVSVDWQGRGYWFDAVVVKVSLSKSSSREYDVMYDDGVIETGIPSDGIREPVNSTFVPVNLETIYT